MSSKPQDPFYKVRDSVNVQVERIKVRHEKFVELLWNIDTANNPEFRVLRTGLTKELRTAEKDVEGLRKAIDMVSKNRAKFPLITDGELEIRMSFVVESGKIVSNVKTNMDSISVRNKIQNDEDAAKKAFEAADVGNSTATQKENARFIQNQRQEQHYMLGEQDQALEGLGTAVDRLHDLGKAVNVELKEQNLLLEGLDDDLDSAGNKMNDVMSGLSKLLKTKDGCTIWTIVILTLILILLIALVIWT